MWYTILTIIFHTDFKQNFPILNNYTSFIRLTVYKGFKKINKNVSH